MSAFAQENFKFDGSANIYLMGGDNDYITSNDREVEKHKFNADLRLNASYKASENLEFNTTVAVGNYLNLLTIDPQEKRSCVKPTLYYLNGKYTDEKIGEIVLGRYGLCVNPYVFQRCCNDDYFEDDLTQDGNYAVLGANYKNQIKDFSYNLWYGRPQYNVFDEENFYSTNFNLGKLKDFYGVDLGYDFKVLKVNGLVAQANSDFNSDKANIFGGGVVAPLGEVELSGNYYNQKTDDFDNAYFANLGLCGEFGKFEGGLEYVYCTEDYNAPGDWDIFDNACEGGQKGVKGVLGYNFNDKIYLELEEHLGENFDKDDLDYTKIDFTWAFDDNNELNIWHKYNKQKNSLASDYANRTHIKFSHKFNDNFKGILGYEYAHTTSRIEETAKYSGNMIFAQLGYSF